MMPWQRMGPAEAGRKAGMGPMWIFIAVAGLLLGFAAGQLAPVVPSVVYARYLSIAILASLDSALGGLRASLEGKYDNAVFVSGFFTNMVLAAGLIYLGDRLGVHDLYLAAVAALGIRLFQNMGIMRRLLFARWGVIKSPGSREPAAGTPAPQDAGAPASPTPPAGGPGRPLGPAG